MVKVVILCGGKGSRLRPVTDLIPKGLVTLRGQPLLQHLVESYIGKGFRNFLLCIGYRGDMIVDYFKRHPVDHGLSTPTPETAPACSSDCTMRKK